MVGRANSRFTRTLLLAVVLIGAVIGPAIPAWAHPAPFSYLDIVFREGRIEGTLVVHVLDVAHDLSIEPPDPLRDAAFVERRRDDITNLVTRRIMLRARSALGPERQLLPTWTDVTPEDEDKIVLRYRIDGDVRGALTFDTNLFPYDPLHQTFINIYEDDVIRHQLIFRADAEEYTYYRGTTQGALEVMKVFIPSGVHHILIGPDHILFLIGLLLTGGTWGALVRIVTAFTIGHSITLSLAALNVLTPPPTIIEPAIALSIVFVGADNLVRGDGRDLRAWVALTFGLVHGFGFANVLREFGLPREALGWSLFSFNVGVEIGQLAIVLVVASVLEGIRRWSERIGRRVAFAGSIVVIAAGTYWFVERVFFPGA